MGINTVGAIHESPANFAEYDIVERKNEHGYNSKAPAIQYSGFPKTKKVPAIIPMKKLINVAWLAEIPILKSNFVKYIDIRLKKILSIQGIPPCDSYLLS